MNIETQRCALTNFDKAQSGFIINKFRQLVHFYCCCIVFSTKAKNHLYLIYKLLIIGPYHSSKKNNNNGFEFEQRPVPRPPVSEKAPEKNEEEKPKAARR